MKKKKTYFTLCLIIFITGLLGFFDESLSIGAIFIGGQLYFQLIISIIYKYDMKYKLFNFLLKFYDERSMVYKDMRKTAKIFGIGFLIGIILGTVFITSVRIFDEPFGENILSVNYYIFVLIVNTICPILLMRLWFGYINDLIDKFQKENENINESAVGA